MRYKLIPPTLDCELTAVERVLTNRGIALDEIEHYLNTSENDVYDPLLLDNMKNGVIMLMKHIKNNDNIIIQVDSDCDGMTSAALLINYLNCLFPGFTQNKISYRMHMGKQHGIVDDLINECLIKGIRLVIAPDSASNDYDQHERLKELGIDTLVIDHHEAEKVSENACVINNQLCDYPTKSLSGVGVVWKFCCYIDTLMNTNHAEKFLDLVAVGMIADMMDVRDFETKQLISYGLSHFRNPFLKTIASKQDYMIQKHGGLNSHTVGFYIAPFVNATMRAGSIEEKTLLFESMIDYRGYEQIISNKARVKPGTMETRVEQAVRNGTNIKNKQDKSVDASLVIMENIIKEKNLLDNKVLVLKLKPEYSIDRNIAGLVANKLANKYQRPTLILNSYSYPQDINMWEGSARGFEQSGLTNFKDICEETGLVEYAQGHQNAFGIGILDTKIDEFINVINTQLQDYDFTPCHFVDIVWDASNFNANEILQIASLENLWGKHLEKPLVAIENIKISNNNLQLLKETTLKISLDNMSMIKFGSNQEEFESLYSDTGCTTLTVIGECKANYWAGSTTPQIEIKDYEITKQIKYYF